MCTSWYCWLKQVTEARDWVQSSTSRAVSTSMDTIKENVADFPETTHPIISQANHKTNANRLRSWSMTLKDQKVRVKKVCQKKHAEWCHCHATKHCSIECKRIAIATYKPSRLTLSPRAERLKDTLPESSVSMASLAWIAEWSGRCKSSWATLKCTNGISKRC